MADLKTFVMPNLVAIEAAAEIIYRSLMPTPQIHWPLLSQRCGGEIWVKHENHTPIGAFKVRGGLVYMDRLRQEQPDITGIITATRGNHGQSVAFAAARHGLKTVVVVPKGNNPEKNAAMIALGAELIEHGHDFQASYEYAIEKSETDQLHLLPSFHPWLVQGVATYSLEFLRAVPDLDVVYVPVGLGSGICGMIAARDALNLKTKIVGVVADNAPAYALSFEQQKSVETKTADTIADGLAVRVPDPRAVDFIQRGVERMVRVSEQAILEAIGIYVTDTHNIAEGAGAAPLAACLLEKSSRQTGKTGLILSGSNAERGLIQLVLQE